ncbi:MAG: hypothetical protein AB7F89_13995 [Pirellulaceae bacterium]
MSQCPASRFSPDFPGYQEIILEDVAPVFEPPALLRRVQSLIAEHNVVMAGIRKAIKAEQSTLRRAKRRLDKDQLALLEADVVKVSHNELPASFHLEQSQRARSSREDLVSRLASLKSVAKTSALESMADYVDDVLQSVSSQKPLAAIAIAGDSKVDATSRPLPLIAQSNLETFIQIAESRLHTIEGKSHPTSNANRRASSASGSKRFGGCVKQGSCRTGAAKASRLIFGTWTPNSATRCNACRNEQAPASPT